MSIHNFPAPGTPPDLTFYYNRSWAEVVNLADVSSNSLTNINIPITLNDKSDRFTQNIGYVLIAESAGNSIYSDSFIINFTKEAGGGGITFTDNEISLNDTWKPNSTLVFKLSDGGSGDYTFANGFIVVETTEDGGRYFSVYFFK